MKPYRVLSLDGGGIRGLATTILMQRIAATSGFERWLDSVDLIAGTSTGGLLALALAAGQGLDTIRRWYIERGPEIFDDTWLDNLRDLGRLRGAEYGSKALSGALRAFFGDLRLGDLRKRVLIPAFDLDNEDPDPARRTWKPKLFHNFEGTGSDSDLLASSVGLYTAAAPTYFPSVDGYIDGGVYANNPAMCALAQTQDTRYGPIPALHRVVLLSLGTGTNLQYVTGKTHDWGYAQWARPLVNIMLDGAMGVADYQCRQLLGDRYHRLAPVFPPGKTVALDEVRRIPDLIQFAEAWPIEPTLKWLRTHWISASRDAARRPR